jgi:FKBP-type peptidyl-prolyl cis-trans isomerase 2
MIKKNDFVELQFTGQVKGGEIFDTNIKKEAEKINLQIEERPFAVCVGQEMVIKGLDNALEEKEIGKEYSIELSSKEAFGERKKDLVKLMPIKLFQDKNINIRPGMTLSLDNYLVKIVSVSGGRVLVDFNNPLAGKDIIYNFTITKKVEDIGEKANTILEFFLRQKLEVKINEEEKKIIITGEKFFEPIIKLLNDKFKDILGYEMVLAEKKVEVEKNKSN